MSPVLSVCSEKGRNWLVRALNPKPWLGFASRRRTEPKPGRDDVPVVPISTENVRTPSSRCKIYGQAWSLPHKNNRPPDFRYVVCSLFSHVVCISTLRREAVHGLMKPHIDDYAKFHPNLSMFIKKLKMSSDLMNFIDISNYFISKIHRLKIKIFHYI